MTGRATITVVRGREERSRFQVEFDELTTILDALEVIRADRDPALLYRHSCHHGSCGTCGVIANGTRVLGCLTRIADLDQPIVLEPLTPFPVIRDLAVDPGPLYSDFPEDATVLRRSESLPHSEPPPEIAAFTRFENCIECGLCESVCPVVSRHSAPADSDGTDRAKARTFKGPAALAAYSREIENRPERAEELIAEINGPDGVWGCDRALQCSLVCPLEVYPARHIAVLQRRMGDRNEPV